MKYILLTLAFLIFGSLDAYAAVQTPIEVRVFDGEGNVTNSFSPLVKAGIDGFSVDSGDLDGNGTTEIIVANGIATEPRVFIHAQDGTLVSSFLAYAHTFGNGVRVAVGDIDGDGVKEIVTGTGMGGGPQIRVFDNKGVVKNVGFFAYDSKLRGGVFVTVADLNNDKSAEIITGAGMGTEPTVKIFTGTGELITEFLAFDKTNLSGVTVGTADTNNDGKSELLIGNASNESSEIKVFSSAGVYLKSIILQETYKGGVTAQGADCNNDGVEDILVSSNGGTPLLRCIGMDGTLLRAFDLFGKDFTNAIQATWINATPTVGDSLVVTSSRAYREGNTSLAQEIRVNLHEQRLYAYEKGLLVKTFLISSGTYKYPTPPGNYSVQKKILNKDYIWTYGDKDPNNYNLPNVKYNLQFRPRYYLHYAYWHNNFGNRMSHGCVNMPLNASEWIYNWAQEGTQVNIQ